MIQILQPLKMTASHLVQLRLVNSEQTLLVCSTNIAVVAMNRSQLAEEKHSLSEKI